MCIRDRPKEHPLSLLCRRPNRYQSWGAFAAQRLTYLEISGNAYTYVERDRDGNPAQLWNLRPDRVRIIAGAKDIKGYYYLPPGKVGEDGVPLLSEDVTHTKYLNPLDDLEGLGYGLSPLLAVARDVDTDNAATSFIRQVFERGAMPMGVLSFEVALDEDSAALAKSRFMEKYGGSENWVEPVVMDQGGKYERIGMTFQELGFDVLDARNEARILSALRVPPILIGTRYGIANGTYSNYGEARTQFWQDVMVPLVKSFEVNDQRLMTWSDGAFVLYDFSVVPALQVDTATLVEAAHKLWQMGVPVNIALPAVGLQIANVPFGDTPYIPRGVTEAGVVVPAPTAILTPPPASAPDNNEVPLSTIDSSGKSDAPKADALPVEAKAGRTDEEKSRLGQAMDDIALRHEPAFAAFAAAQFEIDRREVLAVVGEAKAAAVRAKATINWLPVDIDVADVLARSGDRWQKAFVPVVRGVVEDVTGFWLAEAGLAFDVTRLEDQLFFVDYAMEFWKPVAQTSRDQVGSIIQRGIRDGWSIADMQKSLDALFAQWITGDGDAAQQRFAMDRMSEWRTELIARTESTKATSWGAMQTYTAAGVMEKEWLATGDERTRPTHAAADGQVRAINEAFVVGGYPMGQPGDGTLGAPISEIAACRCTVLPIIGG